MLNLEAKQTNVSKLFKFSNKNFSVISLLITNYLMHDDFPLNIVNKMLKINK